MFPFSTLVIKVLIEWSLPVQNLNSRVGSQRQRNNGAERFLFKQISLLLTSDVSDRSRGYGGGGEGGDVGGCGCGSGSGRSGRGVLAAPANYGAGGGRSRSSGWHGSRVRVGVAQGKRAALEARPQHEAPEQSPQSPGRSRP